MPDEDELLTVEDVAKMLHTSPGTIYWWRSAKQHYGPKAIRVGKRLLYRPEDVQDWLREHEEQPPESASA
jgi:predicted DNA-binding transcriptional regulator AlpA